MSFADGTMANRQCLRLGWHHRLVGIQENVIPMTLKTVGDP